MRLAVRILFVLTLVLVCAAAPALADVPAKMSVQGRLTSAGVPVPAGLRSFTFKIFDQQVGGVEIWPAGPGETQILATDANGLWTGSVGQVVPLTAAVFQEPVRWLEITVYDGVTTETLPRMELKTNPYSYRAATSQHADSLGNATYTDLVDQFVDVTGDEMTGPLFNNWTQKNAGSSVQANNDNDGWGTFWNDVGAGTWGFSADVTGDDNYWNIGVAASARGNNNQLEGNRGVFAYADGAGTQNVGVEGWTGLSGTENYSGYFHNGDFLVDNTQTPGTGGVLLPPDAIDAIEIQNEPGIASAESVSGVTFTSLTPTADMRDLETVTITTPADGYIVLHGNAYVWLSGAASVNAAAYMQIDETEGGGNASLYYRTVGCYAKPSGGNMFYPVPLERIYFKPAGTYTFRIEARPASITGDGEVNFFSIMLTATFFPTSYASVIATVAQDEAAGFEQSKRMAESESASGLASPSGAPAAYQVDLRELELKAARTAAEAEKARRELVEAKAGAALRSSQAPDLSREESHR